MLDKFFKKNVHQTVQFIACIGIAIGLPWSKIPLSLATILLGANVLLLNDWKKVFKIWFTHKTLLFLFLFFAFESLSLLWSSNLNYGLDDLRRKLPFLILPLCISVIPLSLKQFKWLALFFILALIVTTSINFAFYTKWIGNRTYIDYRDISIFISHIRLALLIVIGMIICVYWWWKKEPYYILSIPIFIWLLIYTNISQVGFGYVAIGFSILLAFVLYSITRTNKKIKFLLLGSVSTLIIVSGILIFQQLQPTAPKVKYIQSPHHSKSGNPYIFEDNPLWENGYPIIAFINEEELKTAWEKRSKVPYVIEEGKNQFRFVLWRFLASKNLTKDKEGIEQLSDKEVKAIEQNIPSVVMLEGGFKARFYEIRNQLSENDPNGKSLLMRIIYLKTGWNIAKENFPFGVGSGDVQDAFNMNYTKNAYGLKKEYWFRAHNQFLTILISSGIIGFSLFILLWFTLLKYSLIEKSYFFFLATTIVLISFLSDDTIESQTGVTIAAFLIGLFVNFSFSQLKTDRIR